ncbi:MAG TPA: ATP-binding protein [Gaiellaceae bacterium]|jgi:serine/threonine-protein kinase RsbW|nr:ATP-binding protein [Gaiellaceae bacterium]
MGVPGTTHHPLDTRSDDTGHRVHLRIPAQAEYITLGRLALTGLSRLRELSDETLADLKLALTEACSNSVRHAYRDGRAGVVDIDYNLQPEYLAIEVSDDGPGFDYVEADGEEVGALTEGGLGLAIIRSLADEFELGSRDGGGSSLRFVMKLP